MARNVMAVYVSMQKYVFEYLSSNQIEISRGNSQKTVISADKSVAAIQYVNRCEIHAEKAPAMNCFRMCHVILMNVATIHGL